MRLTREAPRSLDDLPPSVYSPNAVGADGGESRSGLLPDGANCIVPDRIRRRDVLPDPGGAMTCDAKQLLQARPRCGGAEWSQRTGPIKLIDAA